MTKKLIKNKRKFKPVKISDSIKELNKKNLSKFGEIEYTIYSNWSKIVGSFFANHSEPLDIKSIKDSESSSVETIYIKYLHVNVTPSASIEFQHFSNKIIEKINSFFGYEVIKKIIIHQKLHSKENLSSVNKYFKPKKNSKEVENISLKINDKELKDSIVNLGLSVIKTDQK